jgi:hypothetical protein
VRRSRNQIILPTNDKKQRIDGGFCSSIRYFLLFAGETSSCKVCFKNKFLANKPVWVETVGAERKHNLLESNSEAVQKTQLPVALLLLLLLLKRAGVLLS